MVAVPGLYFRSVGGVGLLGLRGRTGLFADGLKPLVHRRPRHREPSPPFMRSSVFCAYPLRIQQTPRDQPIAGQPHGLGDVFWIVALAFRDRGDGFWRRRQRPYSLERPCRDTAVAACVYQQEGALDLG